MGAKSPGGSKNYYGHCAGIICQGQLDFISGVLINNELAYPNAAIWDSKIYKAGRIIIYTDGNAYKTTVETFEVPPNFPWTLFAGAWTSGGSGYALDALVVSGNFVFKSLIPSNTTTPPATASSNADWQYLYTPDQWATISTTTFWPGGSIVAWEGQVYTNAGAGTNEQPPAPPWQLYQVLQSASPNPLKFTVAKNTRYGQNSGPGDYYLYWGSPDQTLDPTGEAILTSLGHPPYRNCAVIVAKDILFGTQTVNPPSIQVLGGRAPVQRIITGPATALDVNWQANPWCVLAEMLTHPIYGLGLPTSWFDQATWNFEANRCYQNTQLFYISPMFTSLKRVSEIVVDLLGYPDAFIFWSTIATLMAGHWPHGEAPPPFNAQNTINRDNIIKEFSTTSEGWWGTANSVAVSIQDIQAAFKSRPCIAPNLFNMAVTKRLLSQKVDRPYITRYTQGLAWATEFSRIMGDQSSGGTIEVQSEKTNVRPGSLFPLTDDQFGTSEVQRCTRKVVSAPPAGTSKITYETERGVAPQPYSPTQTNPAPAAGPSPSVIQNYQIVQLPTSLAGAGSTLALLAGRPSSVTSALEIWFQQADASAYQLLGTLGAFAVAGNIYSGSAGEIATTLTTNTQAGTSYNLPPGAVAFGCLLSFYNSSGTFLGHFSYGTDYTFDLVNNVVTLTAGTTVPNGSAMEYVGEQGVTATGNATPGNVYAIPQNFWGTYYVWYMAPGAAYSGGLTGGSRATEGTDFLIDPVAGQLTIINGGAINADDKVFVFLTDTLLATFVSSAPASDLDAIMAPLTQDEINDHTLLLFAFKAADPSKFEIMSVSAISAGPLPSPPTAPGYYNIEVERQQFGTLFGGDGISDFGPGDSIFIIPRSSLMPLSHESFEGLELSGSTASFILAPQSAWVDAQISDLYDPVNNPTGLSLEFSYAFDNVFGPTVTWIQELQNGSAISSYSGTFSTGDVFYFAFQMNAGPGANIISAALTAGVGEQQMTLWSNVFTPSLQINASAQFSIPQTGTWNLALNVHCDDGSQTIAPLTLPGITTPVTMQVNAAGSPSPYSQSPALSRSNYRIVGKFIENLKLGPFTAVSGLAVQYQLQPRGTVYNSSAWVTAGALGGGLFGPIPNFQKGTMTLYAKSSATGDLDSPVASWNL